MEKEALEEIGNQLREQQVRNQQRQEPPTIVRTAQPFPETSRTSSIASRICRNKGHRIKAIPMKQLLPTAANPQNLVESYGHICTRCGANLAEIRGQG